MRADDGPFEVTQLINSFLGALAHPWESLKSELNEITIDEAARAAVVAYDYTVLAGTQGRRNGCIPIPVVKNAKRPAISEWSRINYCADPGLLDRLRRDYPDASTGIVLGQVCAVDIDVLDEKTASTIKALIISKLGDAPCRVGKAPKSALFFCVEVIGPHQLVHVDC